MAADAWELRTARLEDAYEQVDRRLGALEGRLATLEQKMDTGFAQIRVEISGARDASHAEINGLRDVLHAEISGVRDALHADMRKQFYWLLGVMLSGFLAIGLKLAGH